MKRISIILLLTLAASSMQAQRIKGSDTVLPVAQQTAERFMALNPDAHAGTATRDGNPGIGIERHKPFSGLLCYGEYGVAAFNTLCLHAACS